MTKRAIREGQKAPFIKRMGKDLEARRLNIKKNENRDLGTFSPR